VTGGTERNTSGPFESGDGQLSINSKAVKVLEPGEARVERDPETGAILRVIRHQSERNRNPLNDPLAALSDGSEGEERDTSRHKGVGLTATGIVAELEMQASMVVEKKPRKQSQRGREWVERLVQRYGDDTKAMARDRKLNPMQQTEADIARRVRKWRESGGTVEDALVA
jgi:nucleolar protein 16